MIALAREKSQSIPGVSPPLENAKQVRVTMLALMLGAVILYAPLIGWGVPHATAPDRTKTFATDEILPLEGLAEMHSTFVVSKPDRNYGYPWWHYFVVSAAQTPYVGYLLLSGGMKASTPEYPFGMEDPVTALWWLTVIGRFVSVLMGAGTVAAAYYFTRALWGHLAGIVAALLTMLNYLMFYYSRTGNLDVPAFFWSSIGLAIFAKIMVAGLTVRRAALLGLFVGLSLATKEQTLVLFLPIAAFLLLPRFRLSLDLLHNRRAVLAAAGALAASYIVATGMAVDPQRHITHVYYLLFAPEQVSIAALYYPPDPITWGGTMDLIGGYARGLVVAMSLPVVLVSAAGLLISLRSSPLWLFLLVPLVANFVLLVLPVGHVLLRYLMPITLFVDAFAAYAIVALRRSSPRLAWLSVLVILCGWRLLVGADLAYAQFHDTRYAASGWLKEQAQPGDRVEYFGASETLPHLSADIKSRRIAGRTRWTGEFDHGPYLLDYLAREGPEFLLIIPDWTSKPGMEHSADCPPEVYAALKDGTAGYTEVAFFPPRSLPLGLLRRAPLDNPSVCPPLRILARNDVLNRQAPGASK